MPTMPFASSLLPLALLLMLCAAALVVSAFQDYVTLGVESDLLYSDLDTAIGNFRLATTQSGTLAKRQVGFNNLGVSLLRKALEVSKSGSSATGTEQELLSSAVDALERAVEL